jgi:hypothetical protein
VFLPNLLVSNSSTVCKGTAITLTANAGTGSTYLWSNGSIFPNTNITVTVAAVYTVTAHTSTPGVSNCTSTAAINIGMYPVPTVSISSTKTVICKGEKLLLTATGGTSYVWTNQAPITNTILVNPTQVNVTTNYTVTGKDVNGCSNTGTIGIRVNACAGIGELENAQDHISIYPNPNNGSFVIQVKTQARLVIINGLGQAVRELNFDSSNNYQQQVSDLSNGIYFLKGLTGDSSVLNKIIVNK